MNSARSCISWRQAFSACHARVELGGFSLRLGGKGTRFDAGCQVAMASRSSVASSSIFRRPRTLKDFNGGYGRELQHAPRLCADTCYSMCCWGPSHGLLIDAYLFQVPSTSEPAGLRHQAKSGRSRCLTMLAVRDTAPRLCQTDREATRFVWPRLQ